MKKINIFKGHAKPIQFFVGISNQPKTIKDKFGELSEGNARRCIINTRWGQLYVPLSWMNKKLEIIVKERVRTK